VLNVDVLSCHSDVILLFIVVCYKSVPSPVNVASQQ